ncbi:MAG: hypothetical protein MR806_00435, partial [Subdoligranulum sp.]|nr:hypothetical protein [Subdoligranulum sp.]
HKKCSLNFPFLSSCAAGLPQHGRECKFSFQGALRSLALYYISIPCFAFLRKYTLYPTCRLLLIDLPRTADYNYKGSISSIRAAARSRKLESHAGSQTRFFLLKALPAGFIPCRRAGFCGMYF